MKPRILILAVLTPALTFACGQSGNSNSSGIPGVSTDGANGMAVRGRIAASGLNGVMNAAQFPGGDIGAQVNAAIAALPDGCGRVQIPAGNFNWTTTITKPRCVLLEGASGNGTILNWTGVAKGAAMVVADTTPITVNTVYTSAGIDNLTMATTVSGSLIGLYLGGDPAGVLSPSEAFGDHQTFVNLRLTGWNPAVQWGNHSFSQTFFGGVITNDLTGLYFPAGGIIDSGEDIAFHGTGIQNMSGTGMKLYGAYGDFYFYGVHCDYNGSLCLDLQGGANVVFFGGHMEQKSGPFITLSNGAQSVHLGLEGIQIVSAATTGTDTSEIAVSGTYANLNWTGGEIHILHSVSSLVAWTATARSNAETINSPTVYVTGSNGGLTNNCGWIGCTIISPLAGVQAYNGQFSTLQVTGPGSWTNLPINGLRFAPSADRNGTVLYGSNKANTAPTWWFDGAGDFDAYGNVQVANGSNVVYRCTVGATLPAGAFTTDPTKCGASGAADTGLRVK